MLILPVGCAASGPKFERAAVPANKAVVYVYRNGSMLGAASTYHLLANDKYVATLTNGGYCVLEVDPGVVKFAYDVDTSSPAELKARMANDPSFKTVPCGDTFVKQGQESFLCVYLHPVSMELKEVPRDKALKDMSQLHRFE
jgi:hypothetical protein